MPEDQSNLGATQVQQGDGYTSDLGAADDSAFEALPQSMYDCEVLEAEFTHAQSSGNPMIKLTWGVVSPEAYAGRKLFSNHVVGGSAAGMGMTKQYFRNFVPELLNGPQNWEEVANSGFFLGKKARLKVKVKLYDGRNVNNVGAILAPVEQNAFMAQQQ